MSDFQKQLDAAEDIPAKLRAWADVLSIPSGPFLNEDLRHAAAEIERLRAALLVARKYVLVQSCELSLMPEDAARDLDFIDEALEEDDDQA